MPSGIENKSIKLLWVHSWVMVRIVVRWDKCGCHRQWQYIIMLIKRKCAEDRSLGLLFFYEYYWVVMIISDENKYHKSVADTIGGSLKGRPSIYIKLMIVLCVRENIFDFSNV